MKELQVKLKHYRISSSEYQKICELLGREPQGVEWALFSALWSEHCSYKSSRVHLKKFGKTLNSRVLNSAGENAGVVDLGFGERIVFKMESHNHPSFIEPYQGAATGVGGILRDIFTMGARPIALADYLCFGLPQAPRMKSIVDGVVRGIGGYGNSVGVPTVTGQTEFDASYNNNVLVNALALGLLRPGEQVALSGASGVGNWVVYVGAKTGRDGVHGAAMASESFDEGSEAKKPNVQIGDPYFEKLLIESCLEVLQKGLVVAIQDMGAAGLTSSSFEMASKGQVGMELHLDQVPLRDASLEPEAILLSESQERMLLVCEPAKFEEIRQIFARWGLDAVKVGQITQDCRVKLTWKNETLTELDPDLLVENAPQYERPFEKWNFPNKKNSLPKSQAPTKEQLHSLLASVGFSSRQAIYRQYDQRVGLLTVRGAESDVAFLRLPDSHRALALAVGCRPHWMQKDAYIGAVDAVFYPALQMAIKGAKPVAITDCLNFGNPERKEIMSEFVASVEAIRDASLALDAPVISGNVSFYNETLGQNITSTPAIGVVGLRPNIEDLASDRFTGIGNPVYLLSRSQVRALSSFSKGEKGFQGELNLQELAQWTMSLVELAQQNFIKASQVVNSTGLLGSLAKMSLAGLGVRVENLGQGFELDHLYQVLVEVDQAQETKFLQVAEQLKPHRLGRVQKDDLSFASDLSLKVNELISIYEQGLTKEIESLK